MRDANPEHFLTIKTAIERGIEPTGKSVTKYWSPEAVPEQRPVTHKNSGFKRLLLASVYSTRGFKAACKYEAAFRQELIGALIFIPLGIYLTGNRVEQALLVGSVLLVLVVELLNSAVEAVVDRVGPETHELSGRAKDMGSAAVLLTLIIALLIWGLVLL